MTHTMFSVTRVANGYTVNDTDDAGDLGDCHVAKTQDEVAAVVKSILRGSFGDEKKAAPKKTKPDA